MRFFYLLVVLAISGLQSSFIQAQEYRLETSGDYYGFDGNSNPDWIEDPSLGSSGITVSIWVKPATDNQSSVLIAYQGMRPISQWEAEPNTQKGTWRLKLSNGLPVFTIYKDDANGTEQLATTNNDYKLNNNQWYNLVLSYGGDSCKIYIDGQEAASKTMTNYLGIASTTDITNQSVIDNSGFAFANGTTKQTTFTEFCIKTPYYSRGRIRYKKVCSPYATEVNVPNQVSTLNPTQRFMKPMLSVGGALQQTSRFIEKKINYDNKIYYSDLVYDGYWTAHASEGKFNGGIDEIKVWNKALSNTEVLANMFQTSTTSTLSNNLKVKFRGAIEHTSNSSGYKTRANATSSGSGRYYSNSNANSQVLVANNDIIKDYYFDYDIVNNNGLTFISSASPRIKTLTMGALSLNTINGSQRSGPIGKYLIGGSECAQMNQSWYNKTATVFDKDIVQSRVNKEWFILCRANNTVSLQFNLGDLGIDETAAENLGKYVLLSRKALDRKANYAFELTKASNSYLETKNGELFMIFEIAAELVHEKFISLGKLQDLHNGAVLLDGVLEYVSTDDVDLNNVPKFTLEGWAKVANSASGFQPIFSHGASNSAPDLMLSINATANEGELICKINNQSFSYKNEIFTKSTFVHYAIVVDNISNLLKVFVNGHLSINKSFSTDYSTDGVLDIGKGRQVSTIYLFEGHIDEVRLWTSARSEDEIKNNHLGLVYPGQTDLLLYYRFDRVREQTGAANFINYAKTPLIGQTIANCQEHNITNTMNFLPLSVSNLFTKGGYSWQIQNGDGFQFSGFKADSFTVEAFVKPKNANQSGNIYSQYSRNFALGLDNGYPFIIVGGYEFFKTSSTPIAANQWVHLAVSSQKDGLTVLYIDGEPEIIINTPSSFYLNNSYNEVGSDNSSTLPNNHHTEFEGEIDELRLWKVAKNIIEINENMGLVMTGLEENLDFHLGFDQRVGEGRQNNNDNGIQFFVDRSANQRKISPFEANNTKPANVTLANWKTNPHLFITSYNKQTASNLHGFRVEGNSFFQDEGDFIAWSTDDGSPDFEDGTASYKQLAKNWRVIYFDDQSNNEANLYVYIDPSKLNLGNTNLSAFQLQLLYKEHSGQNYSEASVLNYTMVNNEIQFELSAESMASGYYTLGYSKLNQGQALRFDANSERISESGIEIYQDLASERFTTTTNVDLTLEFWAKLPKNPQEDVFVAGFDKNGNSSALHSYFQVDKNSNFLSFKTSAPNTITVSSNVALINPNQWVHIAVVISKASSGYYNHSFYINGQFVSTSTRNPGNGYMVRNPGSQPTFCLGDKLAGKDSLIIDEVRIWKDARTASEIAEYMTKTVESTYDNLINYYNCNQKGANTSDLATYYGPESIISQSHPIAGWVKSKWYYADDKASIYRNGSNVSMADAIGGLSISTPTYVYDGKKIEWSHNGEKGKISSATQMAAQQLKREWLITSNMAAQNIILEFDLAELGIQSISNKITYSLLYKSPVNSTFSTAPVNLARAYTANGKNFVRFEINSKTIDNGYYTLGISKEGFNTAVKFPYGYNYIESESVSSTGLSNRTTYSIECWVKLYQTGSNQTILNLDPFKLQVGSDDKLISEFSPSVRIGFSSALSKDTWYHVAITVSGKTVQYYIDGKNVGNFTLTNFATIAGTSKLHLGKLPDNSQKAYVSIDELRLWTSTRTASQISNNIHTQFYGNESGLAYYNDFDYPYTGNLIPENSNGLTTTMTWIQQLQWENSENRDPNNPLNDSKSLTKSDTVSSGGLTLTSPKDIGVIQQYGDKLELSHTKNSNNMSVSNQSNLLHVDSICSRKWRVDIFDEYNDGGILRFALNLSDAGLRTLAIPDYQFYLLSENESGDYEKVNILSSFIDNSNDSVVFVLNAIDLLSGYFTLGVGTMHWGSTLALDGSNDYLHFTGDHSKVFENNNAFAIEARVKPQKNGVIFSQGTLNNEGFVLSINDNNFLVANRMSDQVTSKIALKENTYSHVGIIYTGDSMRLFIDGIESGSSRSTVLVENISAHRAIIGAASLGNGVTEFFGGNIEDFKIWNENILPFQFRMSMQSNRKMEGGLYANFGFNELQKSYIKNRGLAPNVLKLYNSSPSAIGNPSNLEYIKKTQLVEKGQTSPPIVNHLQIIASYGSPNFQKTKADLIFYGEHIDGNNVDTTLTPQNVDYKYAGQWKIVKNDYQEDGGRVDFTFVNKSQWLNSNYANSTYYLLCRKDTSQRFKMLDYTGYYESSTDITFQTDGAKLKEGYYALGFSTISNLLLASQGTSDAYVDLSWKIPSYCFKNESNASFQVELADTNDKPIYIKKVDSFSLTPFYTDQYRHLLDASKTQDYKVNIYKVGDGDLICEDLLTATGNTSAHLAPTLSAQETYLNKNVINWTCESDLISKYRLRRTGTGTSTEYFTLDSTATHFTDSITGNSNSIKNGETYTYSIQVYNSRLQKYYNWKSINKSTYNVDFTATDFASRDSISLSWKDISSYCDEILIYRDDKLYVVLGNTNTNYFDYNPVHGKAHKYELRIYKNKEFVYSQEDIGQVAPIGQIIGRVVTIDGKYGVPNCVVKSRIVIQDSIYQTYDTTDQTGAFAFSGLYFDGAGKFTISASKANYTFTKSSNTLDLSTFNPISDFLLIESINGYDNSGAEALSNFSLNHDKSQIETKLNWTYTSSKSTLFQIFRNDSLIEICADTNTFIDYSALPNTQYNYTVNAYILEKDIITEISKKIELISNKIPSIGTKAIKVVADANTATINISWEYAYANIDGFTLWRNEQKLNDFNPNETSFIDYSGRNNKSYWYSVAPYIIINGNQIYAKSDSVPKKYPGLKVPDFDRYPYPQNPKNWTSNDGKAILAGVPAEGLVKGKINYDQTNYNFSGIEIIDTKSASSESAYTVAIIPKGNSLYMEDSTYRPGERKFYRMRAFKKVGTETYYSAWNQSNEFYAPSLPAPTIIGIENIAFNTFKIKWKTNTKITHGTELVIGSQRLIIPAGQTSKIFSIAPANKNDNSYTITLRNRLIRRGTFWSTKASDNIEVSTTSINLPAISDFDASENYSEYVLLSWEYPAYMRSQFLIYRDGELLETLTYESRSFQDKTANSGQNHNYMIRAQNPENTDLLSKLEHDYGSLQNKTIIFGNVKNIYTNNGVDDVLVSLRAQKLLEVSGTDSFFQKINKTCYTDATGYYVFENLPNWDGIQITILAEKQGHYFDEEKITSIKNQKSYRQDFSDTNSIKTSKNSSEIAQPTDFIPGPNRNNLTVDIRFNIEGLNYSGIEIFRGPKVLADIKTPRTSTYIDSTGEPGYGFIYSIRTYWDIGGERLYSNTLDSTVIFPAIDPVNRFAAIPVEITNQVQLQWAHPNSRLDYYNIKRNGTSIGKIEPDVFTFNDNSGIPGNLYKYEIEAVVISGGKHIYSKSTSKKARYPYLNQVEDLKALANQETNSISLTWSTKLEKIDGYLVYRNGIGIADLDANSLQGNYTDFTGNPSVSNLYSVIPYIKNQNNLLKGPSASVRIIFPAIQKPTNLNIAPQANEDEIIVTWEYPSDIVDGYIIFRDNQEVLKIEGNVKQYIDQGGAPGTEYKYGVLAYVINNENELKSDIIEGKGTFPEVSKPSAIIAQTELSNNHVQVEWTHSAWSDYSEEERGYKIQSAWWQVDSDGKYLISNRPQDNSVVWTDITPDDPAIEINGNSRLILDEEPEQRSFGTSGDYMASNQYRIQSYRIVDGSTYYSDYTYSAEPGTSLHSRITTNYRATSFSATKGSEENDVILKWTDYSSSDLIGYKIYRRNYDDVKWVFIGNVNSGTELFHDQSAKPGVQYVYELRPNVKSAITNYDMVEATTEIGWAENDGKISGSVITYTTGNGVPNVEIVATSISGKERKSFTGITDQNGEYKIGNVFIGEGTKYEVEASFNKHRFVQKVQEAYLDNNFKTLQLNPFYDLDAYVVKGKVAYLNTDCPLDSVTIQMVEYFKDGTSSKKEVLSENGTYIIPYNPYKINLDYIIVSAVDSTIWSTRSNLGATYYDFHQNDLTILDLGDNAALETTFNFFDKSSYQVDIDVATACGDIPGNNKFSINIRSLNGCYNQNIDTDPNGKLTLKLPPLNFEASIVGVTPLTSVNYPYFQSLSTIIHKLNLEDLYQEQLDNHIKFPTGTQYAPFTFHKEPTINLNGLTKNCGNDASKPYILDAENEEVSTVTFDVKESHATVCDVKDGYILVKNGTVRGNSNERINIDPSTGMFESYSFVANNPNPSAPYIRYLIAEYYSGSGNFQKELIVPIVVLGTAPIAGNDIIVNPSENGDVQVPLYILRDPPGDQSYSYVKKGTEISTNVDFGTESTISAKTGGSFTFKPGGYGAKYELFFTAGSGFDSKNSINVKSTFSENLSTSPDEDLHAKNSDRYLIGESADIIVGAGFVSQYGMAWKIQTSNDCEIKAVKTVSVDVGKVKSTWIYTVDQIEGLITEYKTQLIDLNNGDLTYETESLADAATRITAYIANWEEVLDYHRKKTLPHYRICTNEAKFQIPDELQETFNRAVKQSFCTEIGSYSGSGTDGNFTLDESIIWTDELINAFNGITTIGYNWDLDPNVYQKNITDFGASHVSEPKFLTDKSVIDWESEYGSHAKNITFSGGTSVEDEYSSTSGVANETTSSFNFETEIFAGLAASDYAEVGLGYGKVVYKHDGQIGITINKTIKISNSSTKASEETSTVGYVLSDNDPGDQYSVFVIKGVDPSQTPYFDVLGGRSSCPYEFAPDVFKATSEGDLSALDNIKTISRDQYDIALETADGQGINPAQRHLQPNEYAKYTLKLTNNSPFGEARYFAIERAINTNGSGATIMVQGGNLSHLEYLIPANSSVYVDIQVKRAQGSYEHDDLQIIMFPACDPYYDGLVVDLKCYWLHPCTEVNIISDNNWQINKTYGNDPEILPIVLGDYDVDNEDFQRVVVKYRRLGSKEWVAFATIEKKTLKAYYDKSKKVPPLPAKYLVDWKITSDILDGTYEIRADYLCDVAGWLSSNVVTGEIDRSSFKLQGQPHPTDGVLSIGESISANYNKNIDCARVDKNFISVWYMASGTKTSLDLDISCNNNQLMFNMDATARALLHGKEVYVQIDSLWDKNGNNQKEAVAWHFKVSNNPVYWNPNSIEIEAYSQSKSTITARLEYEKFSNALNYQLNADNGSTWLFISNPTGLIALTGQEIKMVLNTAGLAPGEYNETITATIPSYGNIQLPIKVIVRHKPPYLRVDQSKYPNNIFVISNYSLNQAAKSTDTMDIIAAYIGAELRGVSRIGEYGTQHAAYLPVYGDATKDAGKAISFRVWRAQTGLLYNANPENDDTLYFNTNVPVSGSFTSPRMLEIDDSFDIFRIIPLQKGWNWFSLNLDSQFVKRALQSLSPAEGDVIKTSSGISEYTALFGKGGQWVSANKLNEIVPENGYQLYLSQADTLYVHGDTAKTKTLDLSAGWNLIGFPRQESRNIATGLEWINDPQENDLIKSRSQLTVMNSAGDWEGSLEKLKPYQAYKVKLGEANTISYKKTPRPENWEVNPSEFEYNMVVTGRLLFDEEASLDQNDLVGAFVDDELRGVAKLQYLPEIKKYRVVVFVYSNQADGEVVKFKLFDNDSETLYDAYDHVNFTADKQIGILSNPFIFSNAKSTGVVITSYVELGLEAYPNPLESSTLISFNDQVASNYQLIVYNAVGMEVHRQKFTSVEGENKLEIDFDALGLEMGLYHIQLQGNRASGLIKVVKQ